MKGMNKVWAYFLVGVLIQGGIYTYLDQVILAPIADYQVSSTKEEKNNDFAITPDGKAYYSYDRRYMAVLEKDKVAIYEAGSKEPPQYMQLEGRSVSYFEWLPDRNLAIVGLYGTNKKTDEYQVLMAQYNPSSPNHELDTELEGVPRGSKIVDTAFSTATNVVYMKVEVEEGRYRIYRTDANYDTRRIYVQAERIGRIAVFFDEDKFFYDNLRTGEIYMFDGSTSGWRVISPVGKYRLVGVDKRDIYIAEMDGKDTVKAAYKGHLGEGFEKIATYQTSEKFDDITVEKLKK